MEMCDKEVEHRDINKKAIQTNYVKADQSLNERCALFFCERVPVVANKIEDGGQLYGRARRKYKI